MLIPVTIHDILTVPIIDWGLIEVYGAELPMTEIDFILCQSIANCYNTRSFINQSTIFASMLRVAIAKNYRFFLCNILYAEAESAAPSA